METKDTIVTFKTKNPRKLGYLLRQAFNYINKFDTEFKNIKFNIKEVNDAVICIRNVDDIVEFDQIATEFGEPFPAVDNIQTAVGAIVHHSEVKKMFFPNYSPTEKDLVILRSWAKSANIIVSIRDNKLLIEREHE